MDISISGLIAQIINFWILFFLFKKYLTKPIVDELESRKRLIDKLENAEQEYQKKLAKAEEESKNIIAEARKSKEHIIADAGVLAEKKKQTIISDANLHAEKIVKEANEKMIHMEKSLENSYEESIKKTSMLVLKKLIKKTPEIQDAYIKESIAEMKK